MSAEDIDTLLQQDIDDLTSIAGELRPDALNTVLLSAADALCRPEIAARLKLLRFVQALAASNDLTFAQVEAITIGLIKTAHADDPTERLAALRALSVIIVRALELNLALSHSVLATFEHARADSIADIKAFANEVLSTDNRLFRRLIELESDAAVAGKLGPFLEATISMKS